MLVAANTPKWPHGGASIIRFLLTISVTLLQPCPHYTLRSSLITSSIHAPFATGRQSC